MELRRDKLNGKRVLKRDLSPPRRDNPRKLQKHIVLVQLFAKAKGFKTNLVLKQQILPFLPQTVTISY